jgi:serine/threonine-protein kinase
LKPSDLLTALHPLLDQALDLPPNEREAWFTRLRLEQPAHAAELEALLAAEASLDARGFLFDGAFAKPVAPSGLAGQRLGSYTLERSLGHGGMGSVWLGRRSDGRYEGQVAIKLLNLALLDPVGRERFRREGSALARLTHPNIGRLIDAGITEGVADGGQPYLVLEYVDGVRIDHYCDERRLDPRDRLALFQQVLAAVAHAHTNLIVHRDIKPSNILVTGDGTVKLLDFGIAKLIVGEGEAAERTELTDLGGSPLTPEYAAPEQVLGGPVTTATDVYALGVLLYLLLAGVHPTATAGRTPAEWIRGLVETEPPPLSQAASPTRLRQLYAGDLDNIAAKALRKEPGQRYAAVAALAEDIGRYLRDEPVLARPATFRYRAAKFLRRHRTAVASAAVAAVVLVVATVVAVGQAIEARRQRDDARLQRDRAVYEEQRATASSGFMETLLQSVAATDRPYTTLELLGRARDLLERDFRGDPRFVARMMIDLSAHYDAINSVGEQLALLRRAVELATSVHDDETAAHAECGIALREAYHLETTAPGRLDHALRSLARVRGPATRARMQCLLAQAQLATNVGPWDRALPLARQAVALAEAAGDTSSAAYADALGMVTTQWMALNRWRDALENERRVIATIDRIGRGSTLQMFHARVEEVTILKWLAEFRDADSVLSDAMRLAQRVDSHFVAPEASTLAGDMAAGRGRPDSAAAAFRQAMADARRTGNPVGERLALEGLILAVADLGLSDSARSLLARRTSSGPEWRRGRTRRFEARVAEAAGDSAAAYRIYVALLTELGFPNAGDAPDATDLRDPGQTIFRAARVALASGDAVAADSLARHTLRIAAAQGHDFDQSAVVGDALVVLGRARLARGDSAGALDALKRAIRPLGYGLGPQHAHTRAAAALLQPLAEARGDR